MMNCLLESKSDRKNNIIKIRILALINNIKQSDRRKIPQSDFELNTTENRSNIDSYLDSSKSPPKFFKNLSKFDFSFILFSYGYTNSVNGRLQLGHISSFWIF